jgi:opacity protein-like surface antigen
LEVRTVARSLTASLIGGAICLTAAHSAHAADMPVKAVAPAATVYSWTGCYLGAQVGAAQSNARWDYNGLNVYNASLDPTRPDFGQEFVPEERFTQWKMLIGGQVGCNWQVNGPWVVGVEAAWNAKAMNIAQNNNYPQFTSVSSIVATEISSIASLTGRLGYAITPDWLIYAKGGVAFAKIETAGYISPAGVFDELIWNDSKWHTGWTVGGGVEYRLFRNVTVGGEYNYYRFGAKDHHADFSLPSSAVAAARSLSTSVDADVHTFMAKLNFYNGMGVAAQGDADRARFGGNWAAFVNSEAKYHSWRGDRGSNVFDPTGGKGHLVYSPTTIGIDYAQPNAVKIETRVKGGYVYANQGTPGQGATYEGPVDTQAAINATFLNFDNIRPQAGVAVNLPTGTSYLPNNQRFARMDPDLVDIQSFGAGFNINPTAGFVIGLNKDTAMSFSAGYAWQGAFIREAIDLNAGNGLGAFGSAAFDLKRKIDPGDVFTGNTNITTQIGKLVVFGTFAYMSESTAKVDGLEAGKQGARYVSNLALTYPIDDRWALALNGSWSFQEKNEIVVPGGGLATEPKNSNSHVLIGSIEPSYLVTERLRIAANYSFLWRDENFYDIIEAQFIPAKTKHTVGLSGSYALSQTASIELRGSHSWIHQDTSAFVPVRLAPLTLASVPPGLTYTAWMASISANFRF